MHCICARILYLHGWIMIFFDDEMWFSLLAYFEFFFLLLNGAQGLWLCGALCAVFFPFFRVEKKVVVVLVDVQDIFTPLGLCMQGSNRTMNCSWRFIVHARRNPLFFAICVFTVVCGNYFNWTPSIMNDCEYEIWYSEEWIGLFYWYGNKKVNFNDTDLLAYILNLIKSVICVFFFK